MAEKTIAEVIEENAKGPAQVSVDGTTVTARKIADIREADRDRAGRVSMAKNHLGLYFVKLVPPGAG